MATREKIISLLEDESTSGYNEVRLDVEARELFEQDPLLKSTVELFCFGDYTYYVQHKEEFMKLTPKSTYKLKQLSLATEALKSNRLQYTSLQTTLDFSSRLELEIFLAESISEKIIDATLLGHEELVKVRSSRGRDVLLDDEPNKDQLVKKYGAKTVSDLITSLKKFNSRINEGHSYILKLSGEKEDEKVEPSNQLVPDQDVNQDEGETSAIIEDLPDGDVKTKTEDGDSKNKRENAEEIEEHNKVEDDQEDESKDDDPPSRKRKID